MPFGYRVRNGETVPCSEEADAVRLIFASYLRGESYLAIAENMTELGIRYHEGKDAWNKHMVKRILENRRYAGADGYPAIVPADDFESVRRVCKEKTANRRETPLCLEAIKGKAVCAACGAPMRKATGFRCGIRWWRCGNENCGAVCRLPDDTLADRLVALLNRAASPAEHADTGNEEPDVPEHAESTEAARMENELTRELGKPDWNEDYAVTLIYAVAAEKYNLLGERFRRDRRRAAALEMFARLPAGEFDAAVFDAVAEAVPIGAGGSLALRLGNGNLISEEGSAKR
jgi:hypothetical protein